MKNISLYITMVMVLVVSGCMKPDNPVQEEQVSLSFQPVVNEQSVVEVSQIEADRIIAEQGVYTGTIIVYTRLDDDEHLYGVYRSDDRLFDLGIVGGQHSGREILSIEELQLFEQSVIRIDGVFGTNAPVQNYYSIEDGMIRPLLRIDTGNAIEVDLDEDGTPELVSSHGANIRTHIYRWMDGIFELADVNEALGATTVYMNDEKDFEAYYSEESSEHRIYEYTVGVLRRIQ